MNRLGDQPLFYLLLLALFAAASYWLSINSQKSGSARHAEDDVPDYEARDFSLVTLGVNGKPLRRMDGRQMRHFLASGSTEIIAPQVVSRVDQGPPWHASAEQGWLSGDGELLFLTGAVTLKRAASEQRPELTIETRDITLELPDQHLKTDAPVRIRSGSSHVEALGMEAWFGDQRRIRLLAQVRAHYRIEPL